MNKYEMLNDELIRLHDAHDKTPPNEFMQRRYILDIIMEICTSTKLGEILED